ncbi:MAG: hypothetical protein QXL02_01085 [Candidatus Anstonellales archaeon]
MNRELYQFAEELRNKKIYTKNNPKIVSLLYRNRDKLEDILKEISALGIDSDVFIDKIYKRSKNAFVSMVIRYKAIKERIQELKDRFGEKVGEVVLEMPILLYGRGSIDNIIARAVPYRLRKIQWLEETYGIRVNEKSQVLNLSMKSIVEKINMLKYYGLDPREYPIRLIYSNERIEWIFDLIRRIYGIPHHEVVEYCRKNFGKSFIDKMILDYSRVKQRYELLNSLVNDPDEFLSNHIKYLTSKIDPNDYISRVLNPKESNNNDRIRKRGIDYIRELGLKVDTSKFTKISYEELLNKLEILESIGYKKEEVLTKHNYILKFSSETLKERIQNLTERGEPISLNRLYNFRH